MLKKILIFGVIALIAISTLIMLSAADGPTNRTAAELFTREQFKKMVNFKPKPEAFFPDNPDFIVEDAVSLSYPASWDWRSKGIMTPVRNQGSCGSCWAFATVALFESLIKKETGVARDLAEQQLVDCVPGSDCSGGYASDALKYMKNNGIVLEAFYPYTATDGTCDTSRPADYYLTNYWTSYLGGNTLNQRIDSVKYAIYNYGPSALYMEIFNDFYTGYSSGVYVYDGTSSSLGGHLVCAVGWKDDATVTNGGYWICKNSWGSGWGESGYFRIAYGQVDIDNWLYYGYYKGPKNSPPAFDENIGTYDGREGTAIDLDITATDPDGDTVNYSAPNLPSGATYNRTTGKFSWTPTYTQSGTYKITFIASDGTAASAQEVTFDIKNVKKITK